MKLEAGMEVKWSKVRGNSVVHQFLCENESLSSDSLDMCHCNLFIISEATSLSSSGCCWPRCRLHSLAGWLLACSVADFLLRRPCSSQQLPACQSRRRSSPSASGRPARSGAAMICCCRLRAVAGSDCPRAGGSGWSPGQIGRTETGRPMCTMPPVVEAAASFALGRHRCCWKGRHCHCGRTAVAASLPRSSASWPPNRPHI